MHTDPPHLTIFKTYFHEVWLQQKNSNGAGGLQVLREPNGIWQNSLLGRAARTESDGFEERDFNLQKHTGIQQVGVLLSVELWKWEKRTFCICFLLFRYRNLRERACISFHTHLTFSFRSLLILHRKELFGHCRSSFHANLRHPMEMKVMAANSADSRCRHGSS